MKNKIFFILSIIFFVFGFLLFKHYFSIFYFQNDNKKIALNMEVEKELNTDCFVCFNKNCDKMKYDNLIYSYKLNQENSIFYSGSVNEIEIFLSEKFENNIKQISVFVGSDLKYYSKDKLKIIRDAENYKIKLDVKNNKTIFQTLAIYILGLFYNWYFYIFGYLFLIIYLIKNKDNFRFKIKNPYIALFLICLLGFYLRISHIDFIPFWNDELYVLETIFQDKFQFKRMFLDPGNPPLFFFVASFWIALFKKGIIAVRILPVLIGVLQITSVFYLVKNVLDKKVALIASFLCAINIYLISESNDFRSYILAMTFVLFVAYYFYKLINEFKIKYLLLYFLFATLLINTHFYGLIYVISNFLLGLFLVKKETNKFLIANIFSFLTIIPYLLTIYKKSLNPSFNAWLEKPSLLLIDSHIVFYFGNIVFFVITIVLLIILLKKYLYQKKEYYFFLYFFYVIGFVFLFAFLVSLILKPILFERYFTIFIPLAMVLFAIILSLDFGKNTIVIIFAIFLFALNIPKYENFNLFSNIYQTVKFSTVDYKNQNSQYDVFFVVPDMIDYVNYFKEDFKDINREQILVSNFGSREDKDLIEEYKRMSKKKSNVIFYVPEICVNSKIKYEKNLTVKKISTTIVPIYKITLD